MIAENKENCQGNFINFNNPKIRMVIYAFSSLRGGESRRGNPVLISVYNWIAAALQPRNDASECVY